MSRSASSSTTAKTKTIETNGRSLAERHFRAAIEFALAHTPSTEGVSPIFGAAAAIADFEDPTDRAALEMMSTAMAALVTRNLPDRASVRAWQAFRVGGSESNPDAIAIRDIAAAMQRTVNLYRRREKWLIDKGRVVVMRLRRYLARQFGEGVPDIDTLEDWVSRHAHKSARGKLTTAGIVARIIHRGRILGARGRDESVTLRRVDRVLARASRREKQLAC